MGSKWLGRAWIGVGVFWLIMAQIKGYHMTEGEKFIELWEYWLAGLAFTILGYLIARSE